MFVVLSARGNEFEAFYATQLPSPGNFIRVTFLPEAVKWFSSWAHCVDLPVLSRPSTTINNPRDISSFLCILYPPIRSEHRLLFQYKVQDG